MAYSEEQHRIRAALRQYARNFRWGTCGACPIADGHPYPEFCEFTGRYDHNITGAALADKIRREHQRRVPDEGDYALTAADEPSS